MVEPIFVGERVANYNGDMPALYVKEWRLYSDKAIVLQDVEMYDTRNWKYYVGRAHKLFVPKKWVKIYENDEDGDFVVYIPFWLWKKIRSDGRIDWRMVR